MYKEKIVDVSTGKETLKNYNSAQMAEVEAAQIEAAARQAEAEAKAAARQALLDKLGISADEAKLLLG